MYKCQPTDCILSGLLPVSSHLDSRAKPEAISYFNRIMEKISDVIAIDLSSESQGDENNKVIIICWPHVRREEGGATRRA
jgi:hypothetical protein